MKNESQKMFFLFSLRFSSDQVHEVLISNYALTVFSIYLVMFLSNAIFDICKEFLIGAARLLKIDL